MRRLSLILSCWLVWQGLSPALAQDSTLPGINRPNELEGSLSWDFEHRLVRVTNAVPRLGSGPAAAEGSMPYEIKPLNEGEGSLEWDYVHNVVTVTNGVILVYGGAVLTAEKVAFNFVTHQVVAEGSVRLERDEQVWASDRITYNFDTREIQSEQFRTGKPPVFAAGQSLLADASNKVYLAHGAYVTGDDNANPAVKVRASYLRIYPGQRIEARNAVLYLEGVPVFYFPFYTRSLGPRANNFDFIPGWRTRFGPYLLSSYHWYLKQYLDGIIHVDYRERRGAAAGPDFNWQLGRWGEGYLRYYYAHDLNPTIDAAGAPIPKDRERVDFAYQAAPLTNLDLIAVVRYQSDTNFIRDFLESEYTRNPQPSTFVELNKFWQNFSLDTYVQPRLNNFLETVERLPEVRLSGLRQELGPLPLYYESQSSIGYYRRLFAETNSMPTGMDYEAARADTFHQLVLPCTLFGWLELTPRVGERFSWYSHASGAGATTEEVYREVFNTGAELSFKASRLWPDAQSDLFQVDGMRHIIQPSLNYVYVPRPNHFGTNEIPQFDYELASLRMLPLEFPSYNSIDSVDSQNVLRLGLANKLQTKRDGQIVNLLNWQVFADWRLRPNETQTTFSDLFSDLVFKPRSDLTLESITRYELSGGLWRMALHTITYQPGQTWSWSLGHFYLRDDLASAPTALGIGNNLFTSAFFWRLSEDWCLSARHQFEARDGKLEEQAYSIYRDLRSWTAALTFRVLQNQTGPPDYTVAFTFSLKAFPKFGLGQDVARPYSMLGG